MTTHENPSIDQSTAKKDLSDSAALFNPLLRESAVVLAGIGGLLYIASHIYGMSFLSVFGIENGFHGVGFAHLAMMSPSYILILAISIWFIYSATTKPELIWPIISSLIVLLSVLGKNISTIYDHGIFSLVFFFSLIGGLTISISIFLVNRKITPQLLALIQQIRTLVSEIKETKRKIAELAPTLEQQPQEIMQMEKELQDVDAAEIATAALTEKLERIKNEQPTLRESYKRACDAADRNMMRATNEADRVLRTQRWIKIAAWCFAGLIATTSTLPVLATISALRSAGDDGFVELASGSEPATPVYWVGDRIVYLAQENASCFVYAKISDNVIAKKKCPNLVADWITTKK